MPNPRQWALLIWIGFAVIYFLIDQSRRKQIIGLANEFLRLWRPLLLMITYVAGWVWLARALGFWEFALFTDTLFWLAGPALWSFMNTGDVVKDENYVAATLKRVIQWTVIVEFVVGIFTFSIVTEFLLVPLLVVVGGASAIVGNSPGSAPVKRVLESVKTLFGLWVLAYVAFKLTTDWGSLDGSLQLKAFALPIWLSAVILPYLLTVGFYSAYRSFFKRIDFFAGDSSKGSRQAKLALMTLPQLDIKTLDSSVWRWGREATARRSIRLAREAIKAGIAAEEEAEQAEQDKAQRLVDRAGAQGADDEGEQLDQREFKETRDALMWLHTAQSGWYNQLDRYRDDLLEMLSPTFERMGLPDQHGITLRVAADGASWWAWRRTVTGWCFAIGAAQKPPDQWLYDGPEPPTGFPGHDPCWREPFGLDAPNW